MATMGNTAPRQSTRASRGRRGPTARWKEAGALPQSHDVALAGFEPALRLEMARLIVDTS
jgi:hypothetical protein